MKLLSKRKGGLDIKLERKQLPLVAERGNFSKTTKTLELHRQDSLQLQVN